MTSTRTGTPPAVRRLPAGPGVYRFRDGRGRALYVGRAVDLRRRVASYWRDLRDRRHLSAMVARIARVEAIACDSEHEAAWLERNVLEHRRTPWNLTAGGQESPLFLRLDEKAGTLRIARTPDGGRLFGPYLGGAKVRAALSALHRLFPLAYAADRLTGAERDMARIRGIDTGDRGSLVAAIATLLNRDAQAVAAASDILANRRDNAAAELRFELAGQLQAEIEGLDWLIAEQKVTVHGGPDAVAYGWADGVLVRLDVQAGRLTEWTQRDCGERTGRERVATTPYAWRAFADRNAQLAARLTGRQRTEKNS